MSTPLPQEIGRTEQALSALLLEGVLEGGPFSSNDEWVAVNVLQRSQPQDLDAWQTIVAETLTSSPERVSSTTARLIGAGSVLETAQGVALGTEAERELLEARRKTRYVSAEIDRQLSEEDRAATVRVLGVVRDVVRSIRERGFLLSVSD